MIKLRLTLSNYVKVSLLADLMKSLTTSALLKNLLTVDFGTSKFRD